MKYRLLIIFLGFALAWAGCVKNNDTGNPPPTPPPTDTISHVSKITINDRAALLLPSLTKQLTVAVTPTSAPNINLVWQSSNNAIVSVNATGLITGMAEGTATIIATSVDRPSIRDSIHVYVRRNYDVYVVGQANTPNWSSVAVVWKNGVLSELRGGYSVGFTASAITVSNNDIYISGTTVNQRNWKIATYWKNGQAVQLTNPENDFANYTTDIAVNGDTVYVTGFDFQQKTHGHYWKSTGNAVTDTPLFAGSAESNANAMALANGKVYVVGTQMNDNYYSIAKYWINDFSQSFAFTSSSFAQANDIVVSGSDVYVLGGDGCGDYGCINTPKIWKNNAANAVSLTNGTRAAVAYSFVLSGNTFFVAGTEFNDLGKRVAKCWMYDGNSVTALALSDGTVDATARAATVAGDDIFIAGYEINPLSGNNVAKYWRVYNKAVLPITLLSTYPQSSLAQGIYVQ